MNWQPTTKAYGYIALVVCAISVSLAGGRPEALVLVAPFALALAVGLSGTRRLELAVQAQVEPHTVTEGGSVVVTAKVTSPMDVAGLEVFFAAAPAFGVTGPAGGRAYGDRLRAGEPSTVKASLTALRWGNQEVGRLYLRARSAFGLLESEGVVPVRGLVTVYPSPEPLRVLARSRWTTMAAGARLGADKASGAELAGVRPYVPGDRARDVNWRVSARYQGLFTNERHPDRGTDVVIALDTFDPLALGAAVRAACALADAYLTQRDRLAVVKFGGDLRWLRPGMGVRQQYLVMSLLLSTSLEPSAIYKGVELLPPRVIPARALVVCLSSLEDKRSQTALVDMRHRGLDVVIIEVPPAVAALPELGPAGEAAYRLWRLQRDMTRDNFRAMGVPTVEWSEDRPLMQVLEEVNAWSRRPVRA